MSEAYRKWREGQERAGREQAAVGIRHVEETKGSGEKVTDKERFLIDIGNMKGSRKTFQMMGVRWVSLFRSLVHG